MIKQLKTLPLVFRIYTSHLIMENAIEGSASGGKLFGREQSKEEADLL